MILDLALIRVFGRSRYISCNPEALQRDMEALSRTHETVRFAFFDHFPYTQHVECGVLLAKKPPSAADAGTLTPTSSGLHTASTAAQQKPPSPRQTPEQREKREQQAALLRKKVVAARQHHARQADPILQGKMLGNLLRLQKKLERLETQLSAN